MVFKQRSSVTIRLLAVGLLTSWLCASKALAGAATGQPQGLKDQKDKVDESAIRALIKELGDDSFDKREAAHKRLAEIGEPALELLQKSMRDTKDPELRTRAEQLLVLLEQKSFPIVHSVKGHEGWAMRLSVSPDGKHFVSSGMDGIRLWEAATGKAVLTYPEVKSSWSLSISADGTRLITASNDQTVRVFELASGKELQRLAGHQGQIWAAALLAGNSRAVTGGWDRSLRLWDVANAKELARFPGVIDNVRCIALSPNGKTIAVSHFVEGAAPVGTIRLWNVTTQKQIREIHGHAREISSVAYSADGKRLLSASFDHTVRLWDAATGKELRQFKCASRMESAVFVEGERRVLCSGNEDDPTLQLWDVELGTRLLRSAPAEGGFLSIAALPGDRRAVTAGRDGMIRILHWKK